MNNYDENNLETWSLEQLKALLREKHLEEIEDIHKQLATKLKTYNKLEEENKQLKEELKEEEEEKCEECGKCLEGEDKCGEGCPSYDKGWNETHAYNKLEEELQQEKDRFSDLASLHNDKSIKIAQLKEENNKLKQMNVWLREAGEHFKEENENLERQLAASV